MKQRLVSIERWVRVLSAMAIAGVSWSTLRVSLQWAAAPTSTVSTQDFPTRSTPVVLPREEAPSNNRTLVIIMGNLRGGELAWKTLYENVLDVNQADLALMIGRNNSTTKTSRSSLYDRARHLWEFDEFDDWADAVDLINGTSWRQRVPPYLHSHSPILGGVKMHKYQGSGAVIFMIRWFLAQELQRRNLMAKYDRFVITRSDHYYLCAHNLSELDPEFLWLPKGQDHGGVTDRHLVVSAQHVLDALDILPPILEHPENYSKLLGWRSGNPEKIIWRRWKEMGLRSLTKRFDRIMFTCAAPGDTTRWKPMSEHIVPEGVHLKYLIEYNTTHKTCAARESSR